MRRGGFPYKKDQDAHQKIQIKLLSKTNVGVAQAKLTHKGDFCVVSVRAFFCKFLYAQY